MGATVKSDSAGEARSCGVVASTPLCVLVLLVVQLVASSSSHTARLTFGTTFGTNVQNVQLNRTQTPPPPQVLGEPNGPRSARLTTFGVTNPKPQNNSNSRPAELLAEQPRPVTQERYTSKLSTVGRKPPAIPHNNTHTPPAPAVSGRTCKSDDNCAGIANTTCMNDPRDNKMRCLCPDKAGPINGHCPPKKKAPGFPCNNDDECVRGATCISPNSTRATGQKLCRCKHEDDDEDDDECSSALRTVTSISLVSALVLLAACHVLTSAI